MVPRGGELRHVVGFHTSFNPLTHKSWQQSVKAATSVMVLKELSIITLAQSHRDSANPSAFPLNEGDSFGAIKIYSCYCKTNTSHG